MQQFLYKIDTKKNSGQPALWLETQVKVSSDLIFL